MASKKRLTTTLLLITIALSLLLLAAASPSRAQATPATDEAYLLATDDGNATAPATLAIADQPPTADTASGPPQGASTGPDNGWHFAVSPYLWFPGVHGTVVAPGGRGVGFRASPGDLLSHFRFGLMGTGEARHKRVVASLDVFWIRLKADKAGEVTPFPRLGAITANMKATEFLLTPKIGLRVINNEKIKIDALTGFRYWHLGESLNFNPSLLGLNFSGSQNFVDPLVGGRIQVALSPKIVANVLGDVGGWGTGSQLEYQIAGLLGYRIKPTWTLQAGYRYLYIDYRGSRGFVFNVTTAGVVFGATITLK
jgi:hypothetical protein